MWKQPLLMWTHSELISDFPGVQRETLCLVFKALLLFLFRSQQCSLNVYTYFRKMSEHRPRDKMTIPTHFVNVGFQSLCSFFFSKGNFCRTRSYVEIHLNHRTEGTGVPLWGQGCRRLDVCLVFPLMASMVPRCHQIECEDH